MSWVTPPDRADTAPLQDELVSKRQEASAVRQALRGLPPLYREVLELHHFRHMKYREIADTLDLPLGTVMNRIHRARKKMKTHYLHLAA